MHELSLSQSIVESVVKIAKRDQVEKVQSVTVEVGALSGVEPHSLEFCFPQAAKGTMLESTQLLIKEIPLSVKCNECGGSSEPEAFTMECNHCKSDNIEIMTGREFRLISMEIE